MCNFDIIAVEKPRILKKAALYLREAPRTVTAEKCKRSKGGPHDYFSEGDYRWSDPENLDGPYIRRAGETKPDNFIAHRKAMIRLSDIIGTLTSAYLTLGGVSELLTPFIWWKWLMARNSFAILLHSLQKTKSMSRHGSENT